MAEVEYLVLFRTSVSDEGLVGLSGLDSLEILDLSFTKASGSSLKVGWEAKTAKAGNDVGLSHR